MGRLFPSSAELASIIESLSWFLWKEVEIKQALVAVSY